MRKIGKVGTFGNILAFAPSVDVNRFWYITVFFCSHFLNMDTHLTLVSYMIFTRRVDKRNCSVPHHSFFPRIEKNDLYWVFLPRGTIKLGWSPRTTMHNINKTVIEKKIYIKVKR